MIREIDEVRARLRMPTPAFWKRVRAKCLAAATTLGGATAGLLLLPQEHPVVKFGTYIIGGGSLILVGIATASTIAVTEPECVPEEIAKL